MVYKFQNSRSSKRIGLVSLIIVTILLASCPSPTPPIPPTPSTGNFNTLARLNNDPRAIWSNGTTMWVSDEGARRIFAYNMKTKEPDRGNYIDLARGNLNPRGIWSDGTTMWVANAISGGLYAYNLQTGNPDPGKNFAPHADYRNPHGIWSDGTTMWVLATQSSNILAHRIGGGREGAKDINTVLSLPDRFAKDIWTDGTTIWVSMSNVRTHRINAYNFTAGRAVQDMAKSFEMDDLIADNRNPVGIWSDGATMWVLDSDERKIFAYNLQSKEYAPE